MIVIFISWCKQVAISTPKYELKLIENLHLLKFKKDEMSLLRVFKISFKIEKNPLELIVNRYNFTSYYEPIETKSSFDYNNVELEIIGDRCKNLLFES